MAARSTTPAKRRRTETPSSKSAKLLYRPVGITGSIVGGLIAGQIFQQVWKRVADQADPPKPKESEYTLREVIVAAAIQGAIFGVVKAVIDRGGARAFQRATGEWPGD